MKLPQPLNRSSRRQEAQTPRTTSQSLLTSTATVHQQAFTLLELLLAVAIFAVVLAAINSVFYGAMRLRSKTTHTFEESLPLQQTLAILKRDLQGIAAPGGVLAGPLQSSQTSMPGGTIPQGATTFYTTTGVIDDMSPFPDLQRVAYYLKNPDSVAVAGRDLVRVVNRNLLATAPEPTVEQWLMGGVERMQLTYFDGTAWRDTWDSATPDSFGNTNNLPRAVKVQIQLAVNYGEPSTKAPVELLVPLVVQSRTNLTQQQQQTTGGQ